ncbi:hypothetical protein D3C87_777450 [compost metagenome]
MKLIEVKALTLAEGVSYQLHVDGWGLFWLAVGLGIVWAFCSRPDVKINVKGKGE